MNIYCVYTVIPWMNMMNMLHILCLFCNAMDEHDEHILCLYCNAMDAKTCLHTKRKKQWTFPVWSKLCLSIFAQHKMQGGRKHIKQWFIHSHLYKQLTSHLR